MVESEETCLFRSNCFVQMTSADHEVTTGKLAPWGGWNEISYQPTRSSSFLHLVPFVIRKAKEMFCSPWFFFCLFSFFLRRRNNTFDWFLLSLSCCFRSVWYLIQWFRPPPLSALHQTFSHPPLGFPETCFRQFCKPKEAWVQGLPRGRRPL